MKEYKYNNLSDSVNYFQISMDETGLITHYHNNFKSRQSN